MTCRELSDHFSRTVSPHPDDVLTVLQAAYSILLTIPPDGAPFRYDDERGRLATMLEQAVWRAEKLARSAAMPVERRRRVSGLWGALPRERLAEVLQAPHSGSGGDDAA
jgi:hypothetical protein